MNTAGRVAGTAVVYMASAIIAEVIVEAALIIINGGRFPGGLLPIVIMLLSPLAGFMVASRYWSETEFVADRLVWIPLFFLLVLVLVLAVSSLFLARPSPGFGQVPATSRPQASPSALPALPPAPTHDLRTQFTATMPGGG
ncbi:MAG: hypothetical protein DLM67_07220 [Candidatus Nephthysia bennettiae]|uniref:Uncharacterized protein n=1 Tax=Candidatus Nephthysia bennettiae TaxID=3127016 RepID=A0A934N9S7_9BACT|nr:hypothetical protein [Candidatus Dormibacteraeota bacterium]MBJ7614554.1 hypothetical protein [Candidatus Dormibacteraeota bacterium]PZR97678.1 MAG: hypothetical protein DLM67_07220 [Candidatus Dormibacteraeota bacterium]